MAKKQVDNKTHKVVYLPHEHTPEMHKRFLRGITLLNDVINELELKRREVGDKKQAMS